VNENIYIGVPIDSNMIKHLVVTILLSATFTSLFAQGYFEGEIEYKIDYQVKVNNDAAAYNPSYPAKGMRLIFKNGSWLQYLDAAKDYEYCFFDRKHNRECWKYRGYDTLIYFPAGKRGGGDEDSLVSVQVTRHAGNVLNRDCNKLVFKTHAMQLTMYFDPNLRIDPAWFEAVKLNYYDVIYTNMKSLYLKLIWETPKFVVTYTAVRVQPRPVDPKEFAAVSSLPMKL